MIRLDAIIALDACGSIDLGQIYTIRRYLGRFGMITVFGSIVLDLVTNPPALPTPGESVLVETFALTPGGKGANQALAAKRAGADVRFAGCVGQDDFARRAVENLQADGVDLNSLKESKNRPTACATVCVAPNGENQIVIAAGANFATNNSMLLDDWLAPGEILQMQLEIPLTEVWQAAKRGREAGAMVILNAAPYATVPEEVLDVLHVLNVNEVEAAALAADHGLSGADIAQLALDLADKFRLCVIVTVGKDGVYCAFDGGLLKANALPIQARDTVGAGDAFAGAFAAALAQQEDLQTCLKWGCVGGSLACLGRGAQSSLPDKQAIQDHLVQIVVEQVA